jgi:hypothetical protein
MKPAAVPGEDREGERRERGDADHELLRRQVCEHRNNREHDITRDNAGAERRPRPKEAQNVFLRSSQPPRHYDNVFEPSRADEDP